MYFNDDAANFKSANLNEVVFRYADTRRKLPELSVVGDNISVEYPYRTADGHLEFIVQSATSREQHVRIQLLSPPEGDQAFRVVGASAAKRITYPPQKLWGGP